MDTLAKHHEAISALVDGELSAHELALTVTQMADSPEDRLTWMAYHVTRDVMRDGPSLAAGADPAFMQRLMAALVQEPPRVANLVDIKIIAARADVVRVSGQNSLKTDAANDVQFRWKWVAGVVSVALVSVLAWPLVGSPPAGSQLASNAAVAPVVTASLSATPAPEPARMLRDPQLDALLAAHRQFGGTSALQAPTGFMRNATFDGVER